MGVWWVTFYDRPSACFDHGTEADARFFAGGQGDVRSVSSLPYPANPRLEPSTNDCPSFCYRPNECAGRVGCPNPNGRSCTA